MPRIPKPILDCSLYVYASPDDAHAGMDSGGLGFIASYPSRGAVSPHHHLYAVTNKHVVGDIGTPTLRLNRLDGTMEIIKTNQDSWRVHPAGDDLAVLPITLSGAHRFAAVDTEIFLRQDELSGWVGPGTETIMLGRFVGHEGRQRNTPALRYGNLAMMPEPIWNPKFEMDQESFLVEMRSLPGYSGSPVFAIHFPFEFHHDIQPTLEDPTGRPGWWLTFIGVDWCHLNHRDRVLGANKELAASLYVESNSGMAGVIPAWTLRELLEVEELVTDRKHKDEERDRKHRKAVVSLDSARPQREREMTKGDFEDALKKVTRKVGPSASDKPGK